MKKIFILIFALTNLVSCALIYPEKPVSIKQVKTDLPVCIKADTIADLVYLIRIPLAFECENPSKIPRTFDHISYFYHLHYPVSKYRNKRPLSRWASNGITYMENKGRLVGPGRKTMDNSIRFSTKSKAIFEPIKDLDSTYTTQHIFKDHLREMKRLRQDTLRLGSASQFIKENEDFVKLILIGDSIKFHVYTIEGIDTIVRLPVQVIAD